MLNNAKFSVHVAAPKVPLKVLYFQNKMPSEGHVYRGRCEQRLGHSTSAKKKAESIPEARELLPVETGTSGSACRA